MYFKMFSSLKKNSSALNYLGWKPGPKMKWQKFLLAIANQVSYPIGWGNPTNPQLPAMDKLVLAHLL